MSACQRSLIGSACIAATASSSVPGVSKYPNSVPSSSRNNE